VNRRWGPTPKKGRCTPGTNNLAAIQRALEAAGVIFVDDDRGEGVVKLRNANN
jgi:hypothetical protein